MTDMYEADSLGYTCADSMPSLDSTPATWRSPPPASRFRHAFGPVSYPSETKGFDLRSFPMVVVGPWPA